MSGFQRKPSGSALSTWHARRGYSHFMPLPEVDPYHGHLPPPFYKCKGGPFWSPQHLPEGRLPDHLHEDTGNYGRGGYYGTTYNTDNRDGSSPHDRHGQPDHYGQLGDRRWSDEQFPWEKERFSRTGYRLLTERLKTSRNPFQACGIWKTGPVSNEQSGYIWKRPDH